MRTRLINYIWLIGIILFPSCALADSLLVSNTEDFSVQFFKIIFGSVANVMLGQDVGIEEPDTVMGEIMYLWNSFLHLVCMLVILWNGFMWMVQAMMGKSSSYDTIGIPLRFVIAIIGSVPYGHGYSLIQLVNFVGASVGIQQANEYAGVVYDNMNAGGDITQYSAYLNSDELVNNLFLSHVCMQLINNYEEEQYIDRISESAIPSEGLSEDIILSGYLMSFGQDSWWGTYDEQECGSYEFSNLAGDESYTNGIAEEGLTSSLFTAATTLDNNIGDLVTEFIPNIWGGAKIDSEEAEYETLMEEMNDSLETIRGTYKADVNAALLQYEDDRQTYIDDNQEAVPSFTSNFDAREVGWMALGATYMLQSIQTQAGLQFVKGNTLKTRSDILPDVYEIEDIQAALSSAAQVVGVNMPSGEKAVSQLKELQNNSSALIASAALWFVSNGDDPIMSAMNYGHNLIAIGELSILLSKPLEALSKTLSAEVNEETTDLPVVGEIANIRRFTLAALETIISTGMTSLLTMAYALIIAGVYFAFYLPALPLIHWIGAALGAVIANVMNIILAPIHIIAHALIDGHGIIGQNARQGYLIMFGAYLRFPLTVIGFVALYPLLLGAGKLVILLYTPYVSSMVSGHVTGGVTFIAITVLLGTLLSAVIERCNNVMHELSDSAMRMIGHGAEALQGGSLASSSTGRFSSDSTSVTQSALEGSKEGHRAKIREEAVQENRDSQKDLNDKL